MNPGKNGTCVRKRVPSRASVGGEFRLLICRSIQMERRRRRRWTVLIIRSLADPFARDEVHWHKHCMETASAIFAVPQCEAVMQSLYLTDPILRSESWPIEISRLPCAWAMPLASTLHWFNFFEGSDASQVKDPVRCSLIAVSQGWVRGGVGGGGVDEKCAC